MNTDYVSREFYRETGEKFSAYLNRSRMEEAKRLLLLAGDEDKIYKIAEQVGCANARYFGQAFKKCTGITPTTYMRQREKSIKERKQMEMNSKNEKTGYWIKGIFT